MPQLDDSSISSETLPGLDDQSWQSISPRYQTVLRCRLLAMGLPLALAPWFPVVFFSHPVAALSSGISILVLVVLALLLLVWVPRKVRRTNYLLRRLDLHLRTGYLWHKAISVAINRIQHTEITQGPIERLCGLSSVAVYTAGGHQSDLKIPGLEQDLAQKLKAYLTERIVEEEPEDGSDQ